VAVLESSAFPVFDTGEVFLTLPALLRLTRLEGVFELELETELDTELGFELPEMVERSNRLIRSFWVADTRRTTGRRPEILSGMFLPSTFQQQLCSVKSNNNFTLTLRKTFLF
jgi:hypothetical protein